MHPQILNVKLLKIKFVQLYRLEIQETWVSVLALLLSIYMALGSLFLGFFI